MICARNGPTQSAATAISMNPQPSTSPSPPSDYDKIIMPLPRGEACLVCRRRKMKCNAVRPVCGACGRAGKEGECEYEDTRFLVVIRTLEDQVQSLQSRLLELERRRTPPAAQHARDRSSGPPQGAIVPAASAVDTASSPPASEHSGSSISPSTSSHVASSRLPTEVPVVPYEPAAPLMPLDAIQNVVTRPLPPPPAPVPPAPSDLGVNTVLSPNTSRRLLDIFIPHASQLGLPSLVRMQLVVAPQSLPLALLETVYAWACRFAAPTMPTLPAFEARFVQRAEMALIAPAADALADVQTHALLAVLAFSAGGARTLDGHQHAGAALRMALALGLHRDDALRETWWMVHALDAAWCAALGVPSAIHPDWRVSTTFSPEAGGVPPSLGGLYTPPDYGLDEHKDTPESLRAKTYTLHAKAHQLIAAFRAQETQALDVLWSELYVTVAALDRLVAVLERQSSRLAPGASPGAEHASVQLVAQCTLVSLYQALGMQNPAHGAARTALAVVESIPEQERVFVNPIVPWCVSNVRQFFEGQQNALEDITLQAFLASVALVFPYIYDISPARLLFRHANGAV